MKSGGNLSDLPTYVLIDVSNIRSCCLNTCNFRIDFNKLMNYLKQKYPKLQDARYYEGIAKGDKNKNLEFKKLEKLGYSIKSLSRKSYINKAIIKNIECRKCHHKNRVTVLPQSKKLKSNVDVFLATELLEIAFSAKKPIHIILFSCDGDYAEAIKSAVKNPNIYVTVIATPPIKDPEKNTLSSRLKQLYKEIPNQYQLSNISIIKNYIS
ncbi:MAG: NYN domain-containing protein [Candidatus Saccharibacteria bacterium]|nr:NYN domain-containing protein [Candidatus Saccharibacteria bacterium]